MYLNFRLAVHSGIFLLAMEYAAHKFFNLESVFGDVPALFSVLAVVFLSIILSRKVFYRKWFMMLLLPMVFSLVLLALLFFIDQDVQRQLFVLIGTILFYLIQLGSARISVSQSDETGRGMIAASTIGTLFIFFAFTNGLYVNYSVELWYMVAVYGIVTFFLSWQFFLILVPKDMKRSFFYSAILAFFSAELFGIASFWPFGYLTTGVVLLIFYYVLWDLFQAHYLDLLTKRRVLADFSILILLSAVVLTTTRWTLTS